MIKKVLNFLKMSYISFLLANDLVQMFNQYVVKSSYLFMISEREREREREEREERERESPLYSSIKQTQHFFLNFSSKNSRQDYFSLILFMGIILFYINYIF